MNDDVIIQQRISGRSVRAITNAQGCSVAQINQAIDRWAESAIDDKHALSRARQTRPIAGGLLRPSLGRRRAERRLNYQNHRTPLHDARSLHAADCNAAGYRSRDAAGNVNRQNQRPHRTRPGQDQGRSGRPAIHPLDTCRAASVGLWRVSELSIAGDRKAWEARRRVLADLCGSASTVQKTMFGGYAVKAEKSSPINVS